MRKSALMPIFRLGAKVGRQRARIGNFVEVKASQAWVKEHKGPAPWRTSAMRRSGPRANIGAGAITCNFQPGRKEKFRTEIGAGAFIGSNACLIAPIRIGEGAVVGAGSVITEDVPPYAVGPRAQSPKW
jgi:bifunctional UDP-N-acetylglucosamine pyrophosphorylase/glucosamine-1-phosphate N-acetyltransferase